MSFVAGKFYHRRRDIDGKYKGQVRGGIITPAEHDLIFLITGESGREHGYEDQWADGGSTFLYYVEGQVGDMHFKKGNLALRDHVTQGKEVHLFQAERGKKGWLMYVGQMVSAGYDWVDAPDSKSQERNSEP